jgi:AcrR family transcriptional regulator
MKKKKLSTRKEPIQKRSLELRDMILKAATYILKKEGAFGLNTNKIAEIAGVNIASLYQYYPNKESILFHLHEIEWEETWKKLDDILKNKSLLHQSKLHELIWAFFESESSEIELRTALKQTEIVFKDSKEFKKIKEQAFNGLFAFFREIDQKSKSEELIFKTEFVIRLITSFAEDATTSEKDQKKLRRQAEILTNMVSQYLLTND